MLVPPAAPTTSGYSLFSGAAAPPVGLNKQHVRSPNLHGAASGPSQIPSMDGSPPLQARGTLFASTSKDPQTLGDGEGRLQPYVDWVAGRIRALGGVATSASLGSTLAVESPENYTLIKVHFGGLCGLLSRYPERFRLLHDKPLNHVAVVGPAAVSSDDDCSVPMRSPPRREPLQPSRLRPPPSWWWY